MKKRTPDPTRTPAPLLDERAIRDYLGVSRTTLYVWRRRKRFPAPILVGGTRLRWRAGDVEAWLAAQPAA